MALSFFADGAFGNTINSFTVVLPVPAGVTVGMPMIAFVCATDDTTPIPTISTPTGWTLVQNVPISNVTAALNLYAFSRIAMASEPVNYTFTSSIATGWLDGIIRVGSGASVEPIFKNVFASTAAALTTDLPAFVTHEANEWVTYCVVAFNLPTFTSWSTALTNTQFNAPNKTSTEIGSYNPTATPAQTATWGTSHTNCGLGIKVRVDLPQSQACL